MGTKNYYILPILILILSQLIFAQKIERESATLPRISEIKSKLSSVTGWTLSKDDQWQSKKGGIDFSKNLKFVAETVVNWQLREVSINDKTYSLFICHMIEGEYKYPELEMDYYTFHNLHWFVFEKTKLEKIIDSKTEFNKSYGVDLEVLYSGSTRYYEYIDRNYSMAMKDISTNIQIKSNGENKLRKDLLVGIFPVIYKEKKLARFFFKWSFSQPTFDSSIFNEGYYEIEFDTFYKFIRY